MPVAKTYSNMEIQGEPFEENKRLYVNVLTPKGIKKVRWYSDVEYARMYPNEPKENDLMDFDARHAFGFREGGYIMLYRANEAELEDFVSAHRESFWRNLTFGYYTPSHIAVPELPTSIVAIKLNWTDVMAHDTRMRPHEEVAKIVAAKIGTTSNSQYQGQVNTWLQKEITVKSKKTNETHFGDKHIYMLADAEGNTYMWETGAKDYPLNQVVSLKMKVKEHKEVNGVSTTVVWYFKEV